MKFKRILLILLALMWFIAPIHAECSDAEVASCEAACEANPGTYPERCVDGCLEACSDSGSSGGSSLPSGYSYRVNVVQTTGGILTSSFENGIRYTSSVVFELSNLSTVVSTGYEFSKYQYSTDESTWYDLTSSITLSGQSRQIYVRAIFEPISIKIMVDSNIKNGSISLSKSSGNLGDVLTITPKPNSGYKLKEGSLKLYASDGTVLENFTLSNGSVNYTIKNYQQQYDIFRNGALGSNISIVQRKAGSRTDSYKYDISNGVFRIRALAPENTYSGYYVGSVVDFVLPKTINNVTEIYLEHTYLGITSNAWLSTNSITTLTKNSSVVDGGYEIIESEYYDSTDRTYKQPIDLNSQNVSLISVGGTGEAVSDDGEWGGIGVKSLYLTQTFTPNLSVIKAEFEPIDVNYTINHYKEQLDGTYKLDSTETQTAKTDTKVTIADYIKSILGFSYNKGV